MSYCVNTQVEDNRIAITDPTDAGGAKRDPKAFTYDFAYDWTSTQEQVHLDLGAPIVEKALQGYNGEKTTPFTLDPSLSVPLRPIEKNSAAVVFRMRRTSSTGIATLSTTYSPLKGSNTVILLCAGRRNSSVAMFR